ncbi:hypothetical protein AL542_00280 [Grimontia hollisae]|nr:hypothetical protein [Grimontia hollisae]AMG28927.2 hypothetical protein AL542_00280 [Grimontia hollisae]MDF2184729.1 hypothetical protein [Grimontia hollisae]STO77249.1 Uncharacterised protein [Grimontia hollisae]STO98372.1 Uncharacterised protein [Grimontia hollisae]STQ75804.1 Uncharacterised protein [Grimontia hollisae]
MSDENSPPTTWQCMKVMIKRWSKEATEALFGVIVFSLLFMLGLVTLGISLLAGIAAIILAKWQQRQMVSDIANPQEKKTEAESIAVAV